MKKLGTKIIALAAVAVMSLSMMACGKEYKSVEDYVKSDEVQDVLSTLETQMQGTGMSIEITADGDKMVYTYTYDSIEKADGMAETLEAAMEAQDETFQNTADEIKELVDVKTATVVIEYVDCNGEMIYSKEYTSK